MFLKVLGSSVTYGETSALYVGVFITPNGCGFLPYCREIDISSRVGSFLISFFLFCVYCGPERRP